MSVVHRHCPHPRTERGYPTKIACDSAGEQLAYCFGNLIILRNIDNPLESDFYRDHASQTTAVTFNPVQGRKQLASADSAGNVRVWTLNEDKTCQLNFRPTSSAVHDLRFSFDGERLAAVGDGKDVKGAVVNASTGSNIGEVTSGHTGTILSVDIRPCRPFKAISAGESRNCVFYEGPPFKQKQALRDHNNIINCCRFSPDGSLFATAGSDRKIFVYDGLTTEKKAELVGHEGSVFGVSWSPDSKEILSVSADRTARVWDAVSGALKTTFTFKGTTVEYQLVGCLWTPRNHLIVLNLAGDLTYLDPANPEQPLRVVQGHNGSIQRLVVDPATQTVWTGDATGVVNAWEAGAPNGQRVQGRVPEHSVTALEVLNGEVFTGFADDSLVRASAGDMTVQSTIKFNGSPVAINVSRVDPSTVIATSIKGIQVLRNDELVVKKDTSYDATAAALHPNGEVYAVGGADGKVRVYSISGATITELATLTPVGGAVSVLAYSPDGSKLVIGKTSRELEVFSTATNESLFGNQPFHASRVQAAAWSEDSQFFATGSLDTNIIIWNTAAIARRTTIKAAHSGMVTGVAFLAADRLVSSGSDGYVTYWQL